MVGLNQKLSGSFNFGSCCFSIAPALHEIQSNLPMVSETSHRAKKMLYDINTCRDGKTHNCYLKYF
jgi:hypothetical protein